MENKCAVIARSSERSEERRGNPEKVLMVQSIPGLPRPLRGLAMTDRGGGILVLCKVIAILGYVCLSTLQSLAMNAHEALPDPALEVRARALSQTLLCPTCAGQTLDDSASETAELLRQEIRQSLQQGQSDQQILNTFVERFGPQVVLKPRWEADTLFLWVAPWVFLLTILGFLVLYGRRRFRC